MCAVLHVKTLITRTPGTIRHKSVIRKEASIIISLAIFMDGISLGIYSTWSIFGSVLIEWKQESWHHRTCQLEEILLNCHLWSQGSHNMHFYHTDETPEMTTANKFHWAVKWCKHSLHEQCIVLGMMEMTSDHLPLWSHCHTNLGNNDS